MSKKELGPMSGGDLMKAWARAKMTDGERKAADRDGKIARLRELAEEAAQLEKELRDGDAQ